MATPLRFRIDAERITLEELIDMQSGDLAAMRDVLAHCLTDEAGECVEFEEARRIVGQLKLSEVKATARQFMEQISEGAVNP